MTDYASHLGQLLFHLMNGVWTAPLLDDAMPSLSLAGILSLAGNLGAVWLVLLGAAAASGKKPDAA